MNMNISRDWLLRMAEKEGNGITSAGGLVTQMRQAARADLLQRIADFEQTRAWLPSADTPEACEAYTRLRWALANLPACEPDGMPAVCVGGIVYSAGAAGSVARQRIVWAET